MPEKPNPRETGNPGIQRSQANHQPDPSSEISDTRVVVGDPHETEVLGYTEGVPQKKGFEPTGEEVEDIPQR